MNCEHCGHPTHKLDDWVDGVPDAWDYEVVLTGHKVLVEKLGLGGYQLCWRRGFMHVPTDNEVHARKAAALFIELYLRGISPSFADKLMDGYLSHLETQDVN
jgi:hypothetical protein